MSRRFYNLPALSALSAFEAAARHQSFKRAAQELSVTPGAVSHQIKSLETETGITLFSRVHRGVELTEEGERLFRAVRGAFLDISGMIEALRGIASPRGVTVGATTAMSSLWLTPVISQFWRAHPEFRVNQVVSDTLEFGRQLPELVVSYGPVRDAGFAGKPLFRDDLIPVCAPTLARQHKTETLAELAQLPLIHLDAPDKRWTSWATWFDEQGYDGPVRRGVKVNNYMIALQAAQDGAGMVLGWRRLVSPYLANGSLIAFEGFTIPAPATFFLSRNKQSGSNPDIDLLERWIISLAAGSTD